jgi:hypothetical protein
MKMLRNLAERLSRKAINSSVLILATTLAFITLALCTRAQAQNLRQLSDKAQTSEPIFRDYKGVTIGVSAEEVHRKLGEPKDASAIQDFFVFSEQETVQVFYDNARKVTALSINYLGEGSNVPDCKAVLGLEIKPEADGSMRKVVQYMKAGYRVSYNRTAGADPLITVTIQKIQTGF